MGAIREILVVEDDADIASLVRLHLEKEGRKVTHTASGEEAMRLFDEGPFDLVVLDLMLPDVDGMDVCRHIRRKDERYVPVMMLTARGEEADKVAGLEIGADDYITKPFSVPELLARVHALDRRVDLLARMADEGGGSRLEFGGLMIDIDKRLVTRDGEDCGLTQKEFEVLRVLALRPGRPYSRRTLCERADVESFDGTDRTIDTHIKRLRAKIEANRNRPAYVLTVWGFGYKFTDQFC